MATLRVACVGTGYFSQFHYDAWRRIEAVELVGAASLSKDEAALTGLVPFDDVQEMLDTVSPDLVDVITPPESHLEIIEKCVQEGVKAIICQKPFCTSLEQAERAVSLCAKAGIKLVVHENFRFQPWYRAMKQ
nr:Gfo/Idh/MocA family oxidoreductase [Rhizobiaceae bacterium]